MSEPAGWYGKLPALGDFASRRIGPGFIEPWDAWLAAGLAAWREADPDGWLPAYLAAPSWRFVLEHGALAAGSPLLAGVLLPSVDSVGRYFPLTLVAPVQIALPLPGWLARLDALAYDALQHDWPPDRLEAELASLGGVPATASAGVPAAAPAGVAATAPACRPADRPVGGLADMPAGMRAGATADAPADDAAPGWALPLLRAARQPTQRRSWWWCDERLRAHAGLPPVDALLCDNL